jgi:hypothetical protein
LVDFAVGGFDLALKLDFVIQVLCGRQLLVSVAERTLRYADCPVLIVKK